MKSPGPRPGRLILIGAGPGDPDLITLRGAAALGRADVVLYDELASPELLSLAPDHAICINVGKRGHDQPTRTQEDINRLAVEHAGAGRVVARLKGGDPFVFGRGAEEASACVAAGIPFEVVPGVSASMAAPAYAGIPVTDRRYSASFAVVTGHKDPSQVARETRWDQLASAVDTLVILMGMRNLPDLIPRLMAAGKPAETPAAAVMNGTLPEQRVVVSTLAGLVDAVSEAGLGAPATVIVGDVVRLRAELGWWETAPLFGRRALVTRAPHQARELSSALRAAGAIPDPRPMIDLEACGTGPELEAIDGVLAGLADYDDILFASSNAARFFFHQVRRAGRMEALRGLEVRVLCIGAKTAESALAGGLPAHFVLAGGRGDAESMLDEIVRSLSPAGRRVLVPRSDIGRSVLIEGLRGAGARVDAVTFYRNVRPPVDELALRRDLIEGRLDILTFTSPSTVARFVDVLDPAARGAAARCIIAAIGGTTAHALERAGLPAQVVPPHPDVREMVADLARYVSESGPGGGDPRPPPDREREEERS